MKRALQAAMVPNPSEGNRYNIINDQGNDSFVRNFGTDEIASFWAPVFPMGKMATLKEELATTIGQIFSAKGQTSAQNQSEVQAMGQALAQGLTTYIGQMSKGQGEAITSSVFEGYNIVHILNPFSTIPDDPVTPAQPLNVGAGVSMTDPTQYRTSWNTVNDGSFRAEGRVGYSVKFVSFDSLTAHKMSADGASSVWSNEVGWDPEAQDDIFHLKH